MTIPSSDRHSPLRVLLVSPLPPPSGGIGRWAELFLCWAAGKPEVVVQTVDISPRWRAVEDLKLWKRVMGGVLQGVRDAWRTSIRLILFRPQVIHVCTSGQLRGPWDSIVLSMAAVLGVRSVYHIHMGRLPEIMAKRRWEWWGLRWGLKLADMVMILDKGSEAALKRYIPAGRVVRFPNAIALQPTDSSSAVAEPQSVLYAGHLIPSKGMNELMLVWRKLRPQGWSLRLAGIGSAAYRKELLEVVGTESRVEFLGDLTPDAVWRRMKAAEIFVLPSYTEGFPNVILEAMAAGMAVISTRVGAIAEILDADEDEPCGIVVPPRDTGAFADRLSELMRNPPLRAELGHRARAKLEKSYAADVVFARLLALWGGVSKGGNCTDKDEQSAQTELLQ
jgi:glycosyltransferase involved in cell wall biosynthesis